MDDERRVLEIICDSDPSDGITFLEILDTAFDSYDKQQKWKTLRTILTEFIDEDIVEERHMPDGRVDYAAQLKAYDLLEKMKDDPSLEG